MGEIDVQEAPKQDEPNEVYTKTHNKKVKNCRVFKAVREKKLIIYKREAP